MKIFLLPLFFFSIAAGAQTFNEKIKVILLGTFHYGATSDRNSTNFADLYTEKRQKELDSIATALNKFGVNKFFLETAFNRQGKQDTLYNLYAGNKLTDSVEARDERVQIAFRTAVKNGAVLVAADYRQELPYDKMDAYETAHKNDTVNTYPFFDVAYPFTVKQSKLAESSLLKYYVQMNNAYNRQRILYDYLHYSLAYGKDADFVGSNFTSSWYDRNLKIFNNILRNIDIKKDKVIVVLFGSSHTAVLHQFFSNHPYFEIVPLENVLQ
jgi:Family of unknown function (DUF5694)